MVKLALDQSDLVMSQKKSLKSIFRKNLSGNGPYMCRKNTFVLLKSNQKSIVWERKKTLFSWEKTLIQEKKRIGGKKHSERMLVWNVNRFSSKSHSLKKYIFFCWERNDFFFQIERKLLCVCKLGICNTKVNCFVADNEAN